MSGFTYCGVHSGKYSVEYIPDPKARWDASPEFDVYEEDVAGRDGGYWKPVRISAVGWDATRKGS